MPPRERIKRETSMANMKKSKLEIDELETLCEEQTNFINHLSSMIDNMTEENLELKEELELCKMMLTIVVEKDMCEKCKQSDIPKSCSLCGDLYAKSMEYAKLRELAEKKLKEMSNGR